jgi:hypothetical protein
MWSKNEIKHKNRGPLDSSQPPVPPSKEFQNDLASMFSAFPTKVGFLNCKLSPEWWAWEGEERQRRECREKVSSVIQRKISTQKIEPEQERCEP